MVRKPAGIEYGVDDKVPPVLTILMIIQHVITMSMTLIFPVMVIGVIHGSEGLARSMIQATMIGMGVGTLLQGIRSKWVGSGYLCPQTCAPGFLTVAFIAVKTGGISLLFGLNFIASIFQGILGYIMPILRPLFPNEVTGSVIVMIGLSLVVPGILYVTDSTSLASLHWAWGNSITGFGALIIMAAVTLWGGKTFARYGLLIGTILGFVSAFCFHQLNMSFFSSLGKTTVFALPDFTAFLHWHFNPVLIIPFLLASLSVTLKGVGGVMTCQKVNDADWIRADMKNVRGGIFATSISNIVTSLFGGMSSTPAAASVGLTVVTGVTTRIIGVFIGIVYIILAFFPQVAEFFVLMPEPIKGALALFVASFMVVAGLQITTTRVLDTRKTFVIGFSLMIGILALVAPHTFEGLPDFIRPVFETPLAVTALSAFILNGIFRLGVKKTATTTIEPETHSIDDMWRFIETKGSFWLTSKDISKRAGEAINECIEIILLKKVKDKVNVKVSFDEFTLKLAVSYHGASFPLDVERPKASELVDDEAQIKLATVMLKEDSDKIAISEDNGVTTINMELDQ